ncbi:MAG: hypothetical protein L6262_04435 [Weeksellaceae bacterium]|nr:hypothetical protein [Weeksellaceae bacterium]
MITSENYHYLHRLAKRTVPILHKKNRFDLVMNRTKNGEANALISEIIKHGKPCMVARLGSIETRFLVNQSLQKMIGSDLSGIAKTLTGSINVFWKEDEQFLSQLCMNAGFFPKDYSKTEKFVDEYHQSMTNLDVLGIWNETEFHFDKIIPQNTVLCKIRELEPWFYDDPWSYELKGKKVLVVHPFEESIRRQFAQKDFLYKNPKILPDFDLKTIKAVQTIAGQKSDFKAWFDALDSMKDQILKTDFDIAIIGCGAYGFPLASFVKEMGKQAIHLGGVTQLLFGIKGKRWEDWQHYRDLRKNKGDHWIYADEIPENYKKIEGGCYW